MVVARVLCRDGAGVGGLLGEGARVRESVMLEERWMVGGGGEQKVEVRSEDRQGRSAGPDTVEGPGVGACCRATPRGWGAVIRTARRPEQCYGLPGLWLDHGLMDCCFSTTSGMKP